MRLANQILVALERNGLSQADLAELTGISYAVIRRAVRSDGNPFLDDAFRIAQVLDLPVGELFRLAEPGERS